MSTFDQFFDAVDAQHRQETARVSDLRDGTPVGDLKADYRAAVYQRRRTAQALTFIADGPSLEPHRQEYRDKITDLDAELADLEAKLDAAGIRVQKIRK